MQQAKQYKLQVQLDETHFVFYLIKDLKSVPLQNNNEESISQFWRHFKVKPAEIILPIFYSPQF